MPTRSPRGRPPVTAEELARYLFGDPLDPQDVGIMGRLMRQMESNTAQVRQLLRLGWALLLVLLTAVLAIAGDAILRLVDGHHP